MQHIDRWPGTSPSRVAMCVGLKGPNASAAIRTLGERGFVRREVDPDDGRAVRLFPTRVAAENLVLLHAHYRQVLERVISPGAELAAAIHVLSRLDTALDAAAEAREPA
jgi:DNA-binding MarR family transcriptional regulator